MIKAYIRRRYKPWTTQLLIANPVDPEDGGWQPVPVLIKGFEVIGKARTLWESHYICEYAGDGDGLPSLTGVDIMEDWLSPSGGWSGETEMLEYNFGTMNLRDGLDFGDLIYGNVYHQVDGVMCPNYCLNDVCRGAVIGARYRELWITRDDDNRVVSRVFRVRRTTDFEPLDESDRIIEVVCRTSFKKPPKNYVKKYTSECINNHYNPFGEDLRESRYWLDKMGVLDEVIKELRYVTGSDVVITTSDDVMALIKQMPAIERKRLMEQIAESKYMGEVTNERLVYVPVDKKLIGKYPKSEEYMRKHEKDIKARAKRLESEEDEGT